MTETKGDRQLQYALHAARMGTWAWDLVDDVVTWSPETERIFGIEEGSFGGDYAAYASFAAPEALDGVNALVQRFLEVADETAEIHYEHPIVRGDGRRAWVEVRGTLSRDEQGRPRHMTGICTDVTERKRVEVALRREKEFTDAALDAQQDTFFVFEPATGRALRWNRAFREITGYTDEEIAALPAPASYYSPEDLERAAAFVEELMDAGAGTIELGLICKDGRTVSTEYSASLVLRGDGPPRYVISIGRDITKRKRAEEEVRKHRQRLVQFMNSASEAFHLVDSELRILEINQPAVAALQTVFPHTRGPEDFVGQDLLELYPFLRGDVGESHLREVLETGEAMRFDHSAEHPGRGTVHMSSQVFKVGEDLGLIATDITARKRAEEDRLLLERQVQHAQKLESLGVLAGGIAHDFNNLLVSILGHAELAMMELPEGSEAREDLEEVQRGARRAAELAKQMLAYSGRGRFVLTRFELSDLVREMTELLQVTVSKKVALRHHLAGGLPAMEGDASQVRQVIMNLLTNASDAIGDEVGVISVRTGVESRDDASAPASPSGDRLPAGTYVFVEVADTGCGMDPDTLARLFDPFFTTKFTGRGLGMAAVQGIVSGHHGGIEVETEPGKGTRFRVLFPVLDASAAATTETSTVQEPDTGWRGVGTVLFVDDESSVRKVGQRILERLGFTVLTARDGQECVELHREHEADIVCVILDLTMPRMDGVEAFHALRRRSPGLPVIMSSGYDEREIAERLSGQGLTGFVQKPYQLASLRARLVDALG